MAEATKTISREGYEKLIAELQELKQDKLPAVLEQIADAKELGDLSENFDYKNALEEKDLINSRIKQIEELIDGVEIVDSDKKSKERTVGFGSKVVLQIEDDDPREVVIAGTGELIVKFDTDEEGVVNVVGIRGDHENYTGGHRRPLPISFESPLGQAIRGKKTGDVAKMRLNNERKNVKIISVK